IGAVVPSLPSENSSFQGLDTIRRSGDVTQPPAAAGAAETPSEVGRMIRAQNVAKYYGSKRALGPVTFEIADGETGGFLGLNGAGKTTALRIFACDLRPSAGTIAIDDIDAVKSPHEVRKLVGFLPEAPPLYGDMLVREYLEFSGRVRGMSGAAVHRRM